MKVRLASDLTYDSIVDGPGLRIVLWAQGCFHNCNECHNPKTHNINGGNLYDVEDIVSKIKLSNIQKGITISGGEPFLQAEPFAYIASEAIANNMDVWVFTGYKFEELINKNNKNYHKRMKFIKNIDIIVDGKFEIDKRDINLKFRGSSNQRIIDVKKTLQNNEIVLY